MLAIRTLITLRLGLRSIMIAVLYFGDCEAQLQMEHNHNTTISQKEFLQYLIFVSHFWPPSGQKVISYSKTILKY